MQITGCHRLRAKTADEAGIFLSGKDVDGHDAPDGRIVAPIDAAKGAGPGFPIISYRPMRPTTTKCCSVCGWVIILGVSNAEFYQ